MGVVIVLRAIKLDDQTSSHAREVDDIRPDRHLTAKMRAFCPDGAQPFP
jgi:hypothetical protein